MENNCSEKTDEKEYTFDVALSFATEQQESVNKVYHYLRGCGLRVFFAPECQDILVGKEQREKFFEVFGILSEYVVLFVSKDYINRPVPMEEANIAFHMHMSGKVIPVYLDDAELPSTMFNPKEKNQPKAEGRFFCLQSPHRSGIMPVR